MKMLSSDYRQECGDAAIAAIAMTGQSADKNTAAGFSMDLDLSSRRAAATLKDSGG
jgi:hypothetical protein